MTSPRDVPAPRTPHFARGIALRAMQALFVLAIVAGSAERSSGSSQDSRFYNGTWSPLSIGNPVPPRREMCFAYDPVRDRIIHIAGSQTWALVFNPSPQWVSLNVPASFEGDERGFYDAIGDRIVVVTGSMDVYALSAGNPTTWEHLFPSGTKPPSRSYFAAAHDTYRNRVLIFGGAANHDTWALSLGAQTSWSQLPVSGVTPPPVGAAAAYDPRGDRMLVFGGSADFTYVVQDVLWALPLSAPVVWNPLDVPEPRPQGRVFSSMIFDPGGLRLVLYGGYAGGALSDVWELSLDNSPTWTEMWPLGPTPLARWSNGLAYRSGGPAMIAYGGLDGAWLTDGWSLSMPEVVLAPHVYSFTPLGGRVGDLVILSGAGLSDVSEVTFAGVPAVIEAASYMQVRTRVPAGATTGRIRVVSPEGAGESPADFFVGETPAIASAVPDSGRYGDVIRLSGLHFSTATNVVLGSGGSAPFTLIDDATMDVVVDSLATTGRISVTTLAATGTSEFDFRRLIPVVLSATPDSGVVGDDIQLLGQHFTGATRVTIGGTGSARFTVDSDTRITFTLDSLASTGVVSVRVPGAVGVGSFTFYRRAPELRPNVRAVRDVAGDQGGRVVVAWRASDLDREPYRAITGYRVWRRVVLGPNTQLNAGSLPMRPSPTSAESATSEYWESVAELPAAFLRGYAYAAATLRDSLPGDNPYTAFFVQALTN
ncbi:MAG TPA: IPT/TIG domain-containing protein, partial [Candidatus Deferrimicrobiaceae bacterium]